MGSILLWLSHIFKTCGFPVMDTVFMALPYLQNMWFPGYGHCLYGSPLSSKHVVSRLWTLSLWLSPIFKTCGFPVMDTAFMALPYLQNMWFPGYGHCLYGSPLSSKHVVSRLWTLSLWLSPLPFTTDEKLEQFSPLPILMQESFWW